MFHSIFVNIMAIVRQLYTEWYMCIITAACVLSYLLLNCRRITCF